jgi:tetratricopeptide (TPR) repeat protein
VALAAAALALGAAAALQCRVWRDGVALWDHAVAVSPDCGRAWMNRGEALADAGRKEEALASFRRMTEVDPANPLLWVHAGNRLFQIAGPAEMAEVRRLLEEAVRRAGPGDGAPFAALGWLLDRQGRKEEGIRMLEEAVRRQPGLSYARYNLGIWHAFEGRFVRAAEELEEAIRCGLPIDLEMDAHDRLVRIYDERKASGDARLHRAERERLRALTWGE